jgi:hypothetical protein
MLPQAWKGTIDTDPDPVLALKMPKKIVFKVFFLFFLIMGTFSSVLKDKKSQNCRNQGLFKVICFL